MFTPAGMNSHEGLVPAPSSPVFLTMFCIDVFLVSALAVFLLWSGLRILGTQ